MSSEEKPPADTDLSLDSLREPAVPGTESQSPPSEALVQAELANDPIQAGPIDAEVEESSTTVYPDSVGASLAYSPPAIARNFENLAAKGGAVGALVLGIWCFAGSFMTNWSMLNGLIGITMGVWGLTSRHKKMAWIGIILCVLGIMLCMVQISELISTYFSTTNESEFDI